MTRNIKPRIMPETWEGALQRTLYEQGRLMRQRHKKYGGNNINQFGLLGCLVRASDKLARIRHQLDTGMKVDALDDSFEDAWRDLANYAVIALMLIQDTWSLPAHCSEKQKAQ